MTTVIFKIHRTILLALVLLIPIFCVAQNDRAHIRSGNKSYRTGNYQQAEVEYKKSLLSNSENPQALYNMGCAMMMQKKNDEAVKYFQMSCEKETNKMRKSKSYHNIGIICQASKMYDKAIDAYSEALRNNPLDNGTRYNLALCQKLRKNQKKDNNKDKNQDKNNTQQKDNPNKDEKNQNKNKGNKTKLEQPQMSKDNAEQLLNAAMQQEQQTQQRLNKTRQQQQSRHFEKNW